MKRRTLLGLLAGFVAAPRVPVIKPEIPKDIDRTELPEYGRSGIYFYGSKLQLFPLMTEDDKKRYE